MKKIISFVVLMIFCLYCILMPKETFASTDEKNINIGIELFKSGQYKQSYEKLFNAFKIYPDNINLNFYLGRAAFEIGKYEMAVMSFERILIASPNENRVKLEIARAFHRLGANDIARQYCSEVLVSEPPETVKKNIKIFLASIDKSEQKHFFNGQFIMGIDWNDNVWASPSSDIIQTDIGDITLTGASSTKTHDWIYNSSIWIEHKYHSPYSNYIWETQGIAYQAIYEKTSLLDLRYFGGNTGPTFINGENKYSINVLLNQVELGRKEYLKSIGLKTQLNSTIIPNYNLNAALQFESKNFPQNSGMDSKNITLLLNMRFLLDKSIFNLGAKIERGSANDDEFSFTEYSSNLSITHNLPFQITGSANCSYQYSHYDEPAAFFSKKREDHVLSSGLNLEKKIWTSLINPEHNISCRMQYQHTRAYSNIELYEYTKNLIQLLFIYRF